MVLWSTWMGQPEPLNKASTILEWNLPNSRVHSNLSPWLQTSCKWGVVRYAKKACCETKLILGLFMQVSAMQNSSARMLFYTDSQRSLAKDLPKVHPPSLNNPRLSKTSCLNDQGHRPFMASKKERSITLQVAPSKIASAGQPVGSCQCKMIYTRWSLKFTLVLSSGRWCRRSLTSPATLPCTRVPGPTFRASHRTSCGQDAYLPKKATSLALCRWDLQFVSTYRIIVPHLFAYQIEIK